jgi:Transglycosylase SLT domain
MRTTLIKKLLWLTFYSLPLIAFAAHGTEPPAEVVSPRSAQNLFLPVKVTIYKSHLPLLATLPRLPANPLKLQSDKPTALEVKAYVQTQATEYGVNPKLALWIVKHESEFNPRAKGDGEASRGLWQISKIYHPEVSDAVAFNVASSTEWSLERIRSGKVNEWSTYRFCRTLYEDCPF